MGLRIPTPSPVRHGTASCGLLVLPQKDLPALTSAISGVPVLVHWVGMTMPAAARGFAVLCVCVCACACACVCEAKCIKHMTQYTHITQQTH